MPSKIRKHLSRAAMAGLSLTLLLTLSACLPSQMGDPAANSPHAAQSRSAVPLFHPDTPPLYCRIGHGSAHFRHHWYDFQDSNFILYRGHRTVIHITRSHSHETMSIQGYFDGDGQRLVFCPQLDHARQGKRIPCASLYTLEDDLHTGIKRTLDIHDAVSSADITCAYNRHHLRILGVPPIGHTYRYPLRSKRHHSHRTKHPRPAKTVHPGSK